MSTASPSPAAAPPDEPTEPASTEPKPTTTTTAPSGTAALAITVLLQSGARHTFSLDSAYLARHGVKSQAAGKEDVADAFDMTVWQLKECIWKDWREDWDQRPASPLFIRLIQFGAYLNDSSGLRDCRFSADDRNVVHMAIRPAEVGDDDMTQRSTKGVFGNSRDHRGDGTTARTPTCRCVIL